MAWFEYSYKKETSEQPPFFFIEAIPFGMLHQLYWTQQQNRQTVQQHQTVHRCTAMQQLLKSSYLVSITLCRIRIHDSS